MIDKKEYFKRYYKKNKEKFVEYFKRYSEKNREKIAEQKKRYYEENKEKILRDKERYYKKNKEKFVEYSKKYYERIKVREKVKKIMWNSLSEKEKLERMNDLCKNLLEEDSSLK